MEKAIDLERRLDGTKMLWHMDRVIAHFDNGERVAPVHIDMGIAKFCNIRCVFCYGLYQQMQKTFIQKDVLLQTMRDAGEIGIRSIAFIGDGEPTMNPHFYEGLREGKKSGLDMSCSTNGILVDSDEKRTAILESCIWMRFCLAAGTKEGYKQFHNSNRFDDVVNNMARLVELKHKKGYDCDVGLQAVFVPGIMEDEMIEEAKLAVKLGVDYFVIKQCSLPDGNLRVGDISFDVKKYDEQKTIEALQKAESLSTSQTKIIPKWNVINQKGVRDYEGCPSIPFITEMSGNGDWYPCGFMFGDKHQFDEFRFGNVHQTRLKEIWKSERYWDIVRKMKRYDVQQDCKGCCRQDQANRFLDNYLNKPRGVNFP